MFCPKCAAQNLDGASFCRVCGANISLVPQALTGQLQQGGAEDLTHGDKRDRKRAATLDNAFRNAFMGIAFLLVAMALAFAPMGRGWWFWMLIPAFSMMGTGVAQYIRFREQQNRLSFGRGSVPPTIQSSAQSTAAQSTAFPIRNTGELMAPPPSVTEGTTRHLGAEAPTKHFDSNESTKGTSR